MHSPFHYRAPRRFPVSSIGSRWSSQSPDERKKKSVRHPSSSQEAQPKKDYFQRAPAPTCELPKNNETDRSYPRAPEVEYGRYSTRSVEALERLKKVEAEVNKLENNFMNIEVHATVKGLTQEEKNKMLAMCRQINGHLDKLQFNEVDAVSCNELHSGKQIAKANRKALNSAIDALRPRVLTVHDRLQQN